MDNIYTQKCISCISDDTTRTIYVDDLVKIVLRTDNQCWLGRCIIVPHEHISPKQLYSERRGILFQIAKYIDMLNVVYGKLYNMSMSNIAQLGNLTEDHEGNKTTIDEYFHVHFHFIPRYQNPVTRYGRTFTDSQFGKALNIDPKAGLEVYKPSDEVIAAMKKDIMDAISDYVPEYIYIGQSTRITSPIRCEENKKLDFVVGKTPNDYCKPCEH